MKREVEERNGKKNAGEDDAAAAAVCAAAAFQGLELENLWWVRFKCWRNQKKAKKNQPKWWRLSLATERKKPII